jgi:chromosome segregation ATPase
MQAQSSRGVQQHEVNAAADALLAQQVRPTVERVRMKIGHGSPNTVAPMLEHWFADLAPRLGLAGSDAGKKLPSQLLHAMEGVWKAALEEATTEVQASVATERELLEGRARELEVTRGELVAREQGAAEREQLQQAAVERAQYLHDEALAHVAQLEAVLRQRDLSLVQARDSIAHVVQEKDTAARDNAARLDALSAELARIQQRADGNERRLLEDVDLARQELKSTQKRSSEAAQRMNHLREKTDLQLTTVAAQLRQLEIERASLTERLAASQRRSDDLLVQLDKLAAPPMTKRVARRRGTSVLAARRPRI